MGPDLVKIMQYGTLAASEDFFGKSVCTITEAYGLLKNMQFDNDPCAVKNYIKKRLYNSDVEAIINYINLATDSTSYALFENTPPTSAAVEMSFSVLSKLLRKDRSFDINNVHFLHHLKINLIAQLSFTVTPLKHLSAMITPCNKILQRS